MKSTVLYQHLKGAICKAIPKHSKCILGRKLEFTQSSLLSKMNKDSHTLSTDTYDVTKWCNFIGPLSCMQSVTDQKVVMWHMILVREKSSFIVN